MSLPTNLSKFARIANGVFNSITANASSITGLSVGSATINSTFFSATANNADFLNNQSGAFYVNTAILEANISYLQSEINLVYANTITAYNNATAYVDGKLYVNTALLNANVSTLQLQITSNSATAYSNAVSYVDNKLYVNTAVLDANVATLQAQITANSSTAYSNAVSYVDNKLYVNTAVLDANVVTLQSQITANVTTLQGQITANSSTAYSNAVSYVDNKVYANTDQLNANIVLVQSQITANSATAYSNAVLYVDNKVYANTDQLNANIVLVQSQITANSATAYSNAVSYVDNKVYANTSQLDANIALVQSQITANSATAYSNAVSYVDNKQYVNTAQLSGNLSNYALLSGATFTGALIIQNDLTVTGNIALTGNSVLIGANNLAVNDAVISIHTPANGAPWTVNDGKNIGIAFHYYDTQDEHALLARENATGRLTWYTTSTNPANGDVYGTTLGGIQAAEFWAGNSSAYSIVNSTSFSGTSNNSTNLGGLSLATIQSLISSNSDTAYTNAVSYVDNKLYVNTSQLSANLSLYALLTSPTFTGTVSTANLTVTNSINASSVSVNNNLYSQTTTNKTLQATINGSNVLALDLAQSNFFTITLDKNVSTITISNIPASVVTFFTMSFNIQGTYTIAWPASFKWKDGTPPTISSVVNDIQTFIFYTSDGGTTTQAFNAGTNR